MNRTSDFPEATVDEINSPKGAHSNILMFSFPYYPLMFSVFVVKDPAKWTLPVLGNLYMVDYETKLTNGQRIFHFIEWQHDQLTKGKADVGIQFSSNLD